MIKDKFQDPKVTTNTVVEEYVKLISNNAKCRLADLASVIEPAETGQPMYFLSHAWKAPIQLLFEVLFSFLANASDDTLVWCDILAVNQHPHGPGVPHNENQEDVRAFEDVLKVRALGRHPLGLYTPQALVAVVRTAA